MIDPLSLPGNEPTWIFRERGVAHEVEPERCRLAGVDFLGAIEVNLGVQICKNNKNNRGREKKGIQKSGGGKMNSRACI